MIHQLRLIFRGGSTLSDGPVPYTLPADLKEPELVTITLEGTARATFYTSMRLKAYLEERGVIVQEL